MKYVKKFIIPLIISCATLILLFIFRSVPVAQLWKGFSVLYVPVNTDANVVLNTLSENGCEDVISYYNQNVPYVNEFLPIKRDASDAYLAGRNAYFFDKEHSVMIYYIPNTYNKNAVKAVSSLVNDYKIDAGLDAKSSFPLATPVICIIVAFLFFIFSKNKLPYFVSCIFSLIFTFTMPFYINAAAVCIYFYVVFMMQILWNRKGNIKYLLTKPLIVILITISLVSSFFVSFVSGILFVLCIASSFLLLVVVKSLSDIKDSKLRFNPVPIRPAHLMNMINIKSIKKIFISVAGSVILFVLYITSVNVFSISNSQDLSFPMPTSYNEQTGIPVMNDYLVWTWNAVTKPYRSVNSIQTEIPAEGETVTIQRFVNSSEGIKTKEEVLFCFDKDFKKQVIDAIDDLNYPAIEKLMKVQDEGFSVNYSYGSGEKFSITSVIIMLVMILLPCGMAIFYLSGRRKYGSVN